MSRWLCALGLILAVGGRAAETAMPLITTVGEFWNVPEAEKKLPHPIDMEMLVYHYDASWKLLYGQTGEIASYLPVRGRAMPIKAGQKIRFEGTVVPADGLDADKVKVTRIADAQLPEALPVAGRMEDLATLNGRWVRLEGYVFEQSEPDATHVVVRMGCEGRLVTLTLQIGGMEPVPQLVGARIRVRAVYDVGVDSAGGIMEIKAWTAERGRLEVTGWLDEDERFKLPRTPIEHLAVAAGSPWVRITGQVKNRETGGGFTVRDETGQIEIRTVQPGAPPVGAMVEVIGRVAPADLGWTLREPIFRQAEAAAPSASGTSGAGRMPVLLRLAEQVLQLESEDAAKRIPVTLRGIVTWVGDRGDQFYVQDVSAGVKVLCPPGTAVDFGAAVTITGVTSRGAFLPEVEMLTINPTGIATLPPPRRISLEQALSGTEEGRWVEMAGYVRQVTLSEGWARLDLTAPTGEFAAWLPAVDSLQQLPGAMVRVRGVCEAQIDAKHEIAGIRIQAQGLQSIEVDEPALPDVFAVPGQTIAGLRQSTGAQKFNQRVRIKGMVTLHHPGRYLYLQDASGGLFVLSRVAKPLQPGDWVEVVGLPGRIGNRLVLREASWRPAPAGTAPQPHEFQAAKIIDPATDGVLVRLRATLRQVVREESQTRLAFEAEGGIYEATVPVTDNWVAPEPGSRVELTGVYVAEFDEYHRPHSFHLELRGPVDVRLISASPWWTLQRTVYVISGLLLSVLVITAWVVVLRRRVQAQTELIRQQLEKESRLQTELERSSRLESLGVLAGGIAHDFNNLLTAILGNLGLAAMDKRVMEAAGDCIVEAERGARRAREITQQLLTFAKGGDPVRTAVALPDVISEAAGFARHGSNVRLDFHCPPDLPPGNVDAGQISRVVHNLVINAVQAMPTGGVVSISLTPATVADGEISALPAGRYVKMTVSDTGRGIPPEHLSRIFDPYFSTKGKTKNSGLGLATVRSIIKKHNGHIEVESKVDAGTTFRVWLPAAEEEPSSQAPSSAPHAHVPCRVLVMDDEAVIRRVAGRMLALAGHEAVFSADGTDAIKTYTAAHEAGRPFDLVIFDLTVPGGMGGKEALQQLLKVDPEIRAIASSGYSSDPIMANPRAYGFYSALPKPYDIPDLLRAVEQARRK